MECLFILFIFLLRVAIITGFLAEQSGHKFWPWFAISMLLPVIATIILLLLPQRDLKKVDELRPVENDEIFDHLFVSNKNGSIRFNRIKEGMEMQY